MFLDSTADKLLSESHSDDVQHVVHALSKKKKKIRIEYETTGSSCSGGCILQNNSLVRSLH